MTFIEFKTKHAGSVYTASSGKSTAGAIVFLAQHDWLKWLPDKFGTHGLLS